MKAESSQPALPAALLKQAAKCKVRECDETGPGHFVAYVDEGTASYDSELQLDQSGGITAYNCDCTQPKPCKHIAALYVFTGKEKRPAATAKVAKARKVSAAEQLMGEVPAEELRTWLLKGFVNDKQLELSFIQAFSVSNKNPSPEEIAAASTEIIRTVLGKSRKFDKTQLNKILQLWKDLHTPIVKNFTDLPTGEAAYASFEAVFDSVAVFRNSVASSAALDTYLKALLAEATGAILGLQTEESFQSAAAYFVSGIRNDKSNRRLEYGIVLNRLFVDTDDHRRKWLAAQLANHYSRLQGEPGFGMEAHFATTVLQMLTRTSMLGEYPDLLQPMSMHTDYNVALLNALLDAAKYAQVKLHLSRLLRENSRIENSLPYLKIEAEVYALTGDKKNRLEVVRQILPYTFVYEDYELVMASLATDAERKKYRSKMITNVSRSRDVNAAVFRVRLFEEERDWKKMLGDVKLDYITMEAILKNFDQLYAAGGDALMAGVLTKGGNDYRYYRHSATWNTETVSELADASLRRFNHQVLSAYIKQLGETNFSPYPGPVAAIVLERLAAVNPPSG